MNKGIIYNKDAQVLLTANSILYEGGGQTVEKWLSDIFMKVYPIGSIYISTSSINPSNYFGGTWVQIKDKFLLACGDIYINGSIGGEAMHTLTRAEIPTHNHAYGYSIKTYYGYGSTGVLRIDNDHAAGSQPGDYIWEQGGGGDQSHNNMPPYLVVYIWKRTA